jgi:hypothetical protein
VGSPLVGRARRFASLLRQNFDHGIQARVHLCDPLQVRLHQIC